MFRLLELTSCLASDVPFWPTFWPAFVATVVGVALGVPAALAINRFVEARSERAREKERKRRLAVAALAVRWTVTWNGEKAKHLRADVEKGDVPFETPLETERWRAVREQFVLHCRDAELQGRVALFFDRVGHLSRMLDRRFEFKIGISSKTEWADEVDRALTGQLLQDLEALAGEAVALDAFLTALETA